MKTKSIVLILIIAIIYSCGSKKVAVNKESLIKEVSVYASTVDNDTSLKKQESEGALSDIDGFKDVGTFKYTVYFDENTNELFKIKNIEITDITRIETYYFQNHELVYLKSVSGNDTKNIYLKMGRVLSEINTTSEDQQLLLAKAKRFQKAFEKGN